MIDANDIRKQKFMDEQIKQALAQLREIVVEDMNNQWLITPSGHIIKRGDSLWRAF